MLIACQPWKGGKYVRKSAAVRSSRVPGSQRVHQTIDGAVRESEREEEGSECDVRRWRKELNQIDANVYQGTIQLIDQLREFFVKK